MAGKGRDFEIAVAIDLVSNIALGGIADEFLADDLTAWTLTTGHIDKATWQSKLKRAGHLWDIPLKMTIDTILHDNSKVAIQSRSNGRLITGETYSNTYMFLIEFNSNSKIRHVREYYDVNRLEQVYRPAARLWEARQNSDAAQA